MTTNSSGLFPASRDVKIRGGQFNYIQTCECKNRSIEHGWKFLFQNIDTHALHDWAERKETYRSFTSEYGTVLERTMEWARDTDVTPNVLWVNGPCSTSRIAQAVADLQENDDRSFATYFVREDSTSKEVKVRFIPTISYQLGLSIPGAREQIAREIEYDPLILSRSFHRQLHSLIIKPLEVLLSVSDSRIYHEYCPILIIVDGFDHLDNTTQTCIIDTLLKFAHQFRYYVRVLVVTESNARITRSLTMGVKVGLVDEMCFRGECSFTRFIGQVWNIVKNSLSAEGRT